MQDELTIFAKAFELWEAGYRANPEKFLTAEEVAASGLTEHGAACATYFQALIKQVLTQTEKE